MKKRIGIRILAALLSVSCVSVATISMQPAAEVYAATDYSSVFDATYYANKYPDIVQMIGGTDSALLSHFIKYGMAEGRQGCASFNVWAYINRYQDLQMIYGNDIKAYYLHYMNYGKAEGRSGKGSDTGANAQLLPTGHSTPASQTAQTSVAATTATTGTVQKIVDPMRIMNSGVSENKIAEYFKNSVFIGDSIMVGYRNYLASHPESPVSGAQFLATTSFSALHAMAGAPKDSLQPTYQGAKRSVWDSVSLMGAKHVFIMFGTNDLIVRNAQMTAENMQAVVDKIQEVNPDVDIHLISMTPIWSGAEKKGALNNETIPVYNSLLYGSCQANGYSYVELHKYMLDDKLALRTSYCSDKFVHLTNAAYEIAWDTVMYNHAVACIKKQK